MAHQGRLCACCFEVILARIDLVLRTTLSMTLDGVLSFLNGGNLIVQKP